MATGDNTGKLLKRLKTGEEILHIIHGSPDCRYDTDPLQGDLEVEKVDEFFGLIDDYKAVDAAQGPGNDTELVFTLTMLIQNLSMLGFWVVGAPGNCDTNATIQVKRKTNQDIIMVKL